LLRERDRELAVADADGKAFREFRHGVFAIGSDQLGECREQACLRKAVAVDAIVPRLRPGLVEVAERGPLLFVIGSGSRTVGNGAGWLMKLDRLCTRSRAEGVES
jgi:hypothetical protein